jgi:hypothetical protein
MGQQGCKRGQCSVRCCKNLQNWHSVRGYISSKKKWAMKRAGNLLRAKMLYYLLLTEGIMSSHMSRRKVSSFVKGKRAIGS